MNNHEAMEAFSRACKKVFGDPKVKEEWERLRQESLALRIHPSLIGRRLEDIDPRACLGCGNVDCTCDT